MGWKQNVITGELTGLIGDDWVGELILMSLEITAVLFNPSYPTHWMGLLPPHKGPKEQYWINLL